jgi:hypothetical protein
MSGTVPGRSRFPAGCQTGVPMILSSLKSLLETGEPLAFPPPG